MFIFDPLYLLFTVPALLFSMWAQYKVKSTFTHYSKVGVRSGVTGAEAAAAIVRSTGMQGVTIERHQGFLSDHYDSRAKTLRLSPEVYDGRSISSIAVAAHEAGHSIQHATGYGPLALRSTLVPAMQIGQQLWVWPFMLGMIMHLTGLMWLGIICFTAVVIFQLVTLPTEINASRRAKAVLVSTGIVSGPDEQVGVAKVLDAAAMTYIAALVASALQLIYMIIRSQGRR